MPKLPQCPNHPSARTTPVPELSQCPNYPSVRTTLVDCKYLLSIPINFHFLTPALKIFYSSDHTNALTLSLANQPSLQFIKFTPYDWPFEIINSDLPISSLVQLAESLHDNICPGLVQWWLSEEVNTSAFKHQNFNTLLSQKRSHSFEFYAESTITIFTYIAVFVKADVNVQDLMPAVKNVFQ